MTQQSVLQILAFLIKSTTLQKFKATAQKVETAE